jgi:hypothetical protein
VNFIKRLKITADATPTAGVFTVSLEEKYYNKSKDFRFREWNKLFIVAPPISGAKL